MLKVFKDTNENSYDDLYDMRGDRMITFQYTVKSHMGLHARPASDLSAMARTFSSTITVYSRQRSANVRRIVELMEINAGRNEILFFEIEGSDEQQAADELRRYCERRL